MSLLVEPIKAYFGLSATQYAALQSLAFGTFYVLGPIPLGILVDRCQRRYVIAGASRSLTSAIWSYGTTPAPCIGRFTMRRIVDV